VNFVSSITLQFKDAFSSGFANARNSFAGMKAALGEINQNQSMNSLAADLAMASALTQPFRDGLSGMLDEPSRLAGTFESSMKNIQAITGASANEISKLGGELNKIGGQSAAGTLAVAGAFNDVAGGIAMVSEGVPLLDAQMRVLNNALSLAEAGQADLGVATNGLVKIMNSYGFTMGSLAEIDGKAAWASDVMTQAVGMGMGSMQEFVSAMAPISGMAASVGVGFDEIGSTMAYMTATTDSAATAGTKLSAFMTALQKPSDALAAALESVGITSGSAMLAEFGLAESAMIVNRAFGGNQDAIAQAMGRQEAMKAVVSLTADAYSGFAQQFGETMSGVTAAAQVIQVESYESKVGRLNAATDSLKVQIGGDINAIKGFFVDMGAGFLTHVAAPILSSPVGGVFQGIAAATGLAAKTVLDLGSGALNTATQLVVMTATIQNAGGFTKLFGSALGGLASPLRNIGTSIAGMVGPLIAKTAATFAATAAEVGFAGAMWATAGAVWAATWPILAVVAGVAALALGGYMLVKHWDAVSGFFVNLWNTITGAFSAAFDWIQNLLGGVSNKVLGVLAVFLPFIGIPALIIKNWDTIAAFFAGLWSRITTLVSTVWTGIKNFFAGLWLDITAGVANAWNGMLSFFNSVWSGIVQTVLSVANWLSGVWTGITGGFASAWLWVKDLVVSVWENIKGVVLGFVEWLSPVIDAIIAPFKAIGNVIGEIVNGIGGWFGNTVELGKAELAKRNEAKTTVPADTPFTDATASAVSSSFTDRWQFIPPADTAAPAAASAVTPFTAATTNAAAPQLIPPVAAAPFQTSAGTAMSGGNAVLAEHLAAASRKGVATTDLGVSASDAFMSAGASALPVIPDFSGETQTDFPIAARPVESPSLRPFWKDEEAKPAKSEPRVVKIENLYLQADDTLDLLNFLRQLEHAVLQPVEVAV
jgi:TP901 family phage tail tape measure protein